MALIYRAIFEVEDPAKGFVDRLQRAQEAAPGAMAAEPAGDDFEPALCMEAIERARQALEMVVIPDEVDEGVEALDAHGDESWADRGWRALRALDNYARLKASEEFDGSFAMYCGQSAGDFVIPASWVVPTESAQTMANKRFRDLRVLPVAPEVDESGSILMEEHLRIERGGTPSPRIHYYDDTRGESRRIHIGWFGDHLDSWAKS